MQEGSRSVGAFTSERRNLDFISLRQAKKLAKTTDYPMYLGIIRGTDDWNVPPQKLKTKKSKSKLGTAHGMTEGEKRRLMKETGPVTKEISAEIVMQEHIQKADPEVRASLKGILEDYHDIFPSKLPYGPPPKRQLDHEIDTVPGEAPPHKSPYRLSSTEMEELRRQVELLLEQGWIRPSSSPYGAPVLFVPKKDGKWRMCIDYRASEQNHNQKPISTAKSRRAHGSPARSALLHEDRPLLWIPSDPSKRV